MNEPKSATAGRMRRAWDAVRRTDPIWVALSASVDIGAVIGVAYAAPLLP